MSIKRQGAADSSPPDNGTSSGWEAANLTNKLQFFNPYAEIRHSENRLPHWQQNGAVYFITFRLADAIPWKLQQDWQRERETWLSLHPEPWSPEDELKYQKRFSGKIEQWLDAGYGSCILRLQSCGSIVDEALSHFRR